MGARQWHVAVLALAASCATALLVRAPWWAGAALAVSFAVVAPAVAVLTFMRVRDRLVSVVVALVAGPALWSLVAAVEVLLGAWYPRLTILAGCVVFAASSVLALRRQRGQAGAPSAASAPD